ncbi:AEP2 (YMR282C) [Zygosaccharomyces parabailii]|nr:AEP2 (YMR282C) [Zygosaccharomyces parabailii]
MLRSACSTTHVARALSSTLAFEHIATAGTGTVTVTNTVTTKNKESLQTSAKTLGHEMLEAESKYIKPLLNYTNPSQVPVSPNSKIREYLKNGQYIKLLIKLSVDSHLDQNYISNLFINGSLTKKEYSVFLNKLLAEEALNARLSNVIPDTPHTELIYRLFEIYCDQVMTTEHITLLQLHDLNLFVKTFILEGQLSKAQKVLDYILKKRPLEALLENADVEVIIQVLRLRCGALSKYWKIQPTAQKSSTTKRLGDGKSNCHLSSTYKCQDNKIVLQVINALLGENKWKSRRSPQLDSAIIYSLGYLGQMDLIKKYIKHKWTRADEEVGGCPNSDLLVAVVTSYCMKDGNMKQALQVLDQFIKRYPSVHLDAVFWRRLLQLSSAMWDKRLDNKASVSHGCWEILKHWHSERNIKIPIDHGILQELYPIFAQTRNRKGAIEVLTQFFVSTFIKPEFAIRGSEMALLRKYQRLILKLTAAKGNYHKGLQFCKEWSVNGANRIEMQNYFLERREIYDRKCRLQKDRKATLQLQYDQMEEEDMLLGRLW